MSRHTPGPWTATGHGRVIAHARPPAWRTLAEIYGVHGDEEQADADAHLIAAAPDLLAACEALVEAQRRADAGEHGGFGLYVDAVDIARAAIAKAKGEAT